MGEQSDVGPVAFRSRYAICDDCECVTIIQRDEPRGVPDEELWEEFPRCMVCGESMHGWDANERTIDDEYWAKGKAAGFATALRLIEEVIGAGSFGLGRPEWKTTDHNGAHDVIRVDALRAALNPPKPGDA